MSLVTDALVLGIIEAAPLILAAAGFTLIFYLNGFINVAYAENITLLNRTGSCMSRQSIISGPNQQSVC